MSADDEDDNIVWGNDGGDDDDNIVWGNNPQLGSIMRWGGGSVGASRDRARRTARQ